ncbi:MAG: hypothetical protein IJJ33_02190 [Victivallales bacterium]|nr:hypothetical protein [Victivallales bacterium]
MKSLCFAILSFGLTIVLFAQAPVFTLHLENAAKTSGSWHFGGEGRRCLHVKEGTLVFRLEAAPGRGDSVSVPVPLVSSGQFDFEVWLEPGSASGRGAGLMVSLYHLSTFFHDHCQDWRSWRPSPESHRETDFNVEPPGHRFLTTTTTGRWMHCRILFDRKRDYAEYYLNDLDNPVSMQDGVPVWGMDEVLGGHLVIANMGQTRIPYECRLRNLELREIKEEDSMGEKRNQVLLLTGYSYDGTELCSALQKSRLSFTEYRLESVGSRVEPENNLVWRKLPGSKALGSARTLLLADAPAGPNGILPSPWLASLERHVKSGMHLIVAGGLFTLERGEFRNTPLEKILPLELPSPNTPLAVTALRGLQVTGSPELCKLVADTLDLILNAVHPSPDATIILHADGHPLVFTRPLGKGRVTVLPACPLPENTGRSKSAVQMTNLLLQLIRE